MLLPEVPLVPYARTRACSQSHQRAQLRSEGELPRKAPQDTARPIPESPFCSSQFTLPVARAASCECTSRETRTAFGLFHNFRRSSRVMRPFFDPPLASRCFSERFSVFRPTAGSTFSLESYPHPLPPHAGCGRFSTQVYPALSIVCHIVVVSFSSENWFASGDFCHFFLSVYIVSASFTKVLP